MIIRTKAPLRLSFAGGGTDLDVYSDSFGGFVLNATINLYAYCTIEPQSNGKVAFYATDFEKAYSFTAENYMECNATELPLHKGVYDRIVNQFNQGKPLSLKMTTYTDAPPGSGLGSSSTLVVAMIKAYVEWLGLPLGDYDIAHLAWEIERIDLGQKGGKQDQYAATFGGFNFIEFYKGDRVIVNPLRIKHWVRCELEDSLLLYYTGISRDSSKIIEQQIDNTRNNKKESLEGMHELKKSALKMKEALLKGNFKDFVSTLNAGWEAKRKTSAVISNLQIDEAYSIAMRSGAYGGKVSGAGGGGFIMFYVNPVQKIEVTRALTALGGTVHNVSFSESGVKGWKIG